MKGKDRADQYLIYHAAQRKVIKWSKASAKLCTLHCIFVYKTLNKHKHMKYKHFLHEVTMSWVSEIQNPGGREEFAARHTVACRTYEVK
jgi:hypothetical protein